jgi:hypothetical protein
MKDPQEPAKRPDQTSSDGEQESNPPRRYPAPKQRDLSEAEKLQLRARLEEGDSDTYALAEEFGCTASQVAGIKAAMHR